MSKKDKLLVVEVVAGRNLLAKDNGKADPYVVVAFGNEKFKTKVIRNLNPVWSIGSQSEKFVFEKAFPGGSAAAKELTLRCMNWERFSHDERMGMVKIEISKLDSQAVDEWLPLQPQRSGDSVEGDLHVRASIVSRDEYEFNYSPLWLSVKSGDQDAVRAQLVNKSFDPKEKDPKTEETLLHFACTGGDVEIVQSLLSNDFSVTAVDKEGNTPLHTYCRHFRVPSNLLQQFLGKGAQINAVNNFGETPLHHVIFNPSLKVVLAELLLKAGADPNIQAKNKDTPLHYAVQLGREDLVRLLVCHNSDLTIKGSKDLIPLTLAKALGFNAVEETISSTSELKHHLVKIGLEKYLFTLANEEFYLDHFQDLANSKVFAKLIRNEEDRTKLINSAIRKITKTSRSLCLQKKEDEAKMRSIIVHKMVDPSITGSYQFPWEIDLDDLEFVQMLGDGASGAVYKGYFNGKTICAIKVLKPTGNNWDKEVKEFIDEFSVALKVKSPNIVDFLGATLKQKLCMVMEFCEKGSLYSVLKDESQVLDWGVSLRMLEEIVTGVAALHSQVPKILHRDLKTLNVLVTDSLSCKLCDFGLSRFDTQSAQVTLHKCRGTYAYIAPEVCSHQGYFVESDIYSISIMIWEFVNRLITGTYEKPYADIKPEMAILKVAHQDGVRPDIPENTPASLVSLIERTWDPDYKKRPTSVELKSELQKIRDEYEQNKQTWDALVKNIEKKKKKSKK